MSNPRLTDDEAWAFLEEQRVGIFTSMRRDGTPISLPVWYVPWHRRIYLHGPASSKKMSRVRNNSRAAFLCETGERWVDLRAVHFTGDAQIVDDETFASLVSAEFDRRYSNLRPPRGQLEGPMKAHYRQFSVIEITPDSRVLSWDNRRFGIS